jgi:hypothetical protein
MEQFDKLGEYKLFVEDTARFTERRQTISNIYVAVNSLLLAGIALLIKDIGSRGAMGPILPLPLIVAGIFVCIWWRQLIFKYKRLVGFRIDALHEIENHPAMEDSIRMYHKEDELYPRDEEGNEDKSKGPAFSDIERRLPTLFGVLYVVFGLILLCALDYAR